MPSVTIVTPTHNRPEMFSECAAAVLAQSFQDWTWWVVFNCWQWPTQYDTAMLRQGLSSICVDRQERPPHILWEDPRVNLIWFPTVENLRGTCHVPSRIVNWLYPKVTTPYIYWLSDDDLIDPDGLKVLVEAAKHEPFFEERKHAVYGRCEVVDQQPDGSYKHGSWCYDAGDVGGDTGIDPHCLLDGGQVLHTKALWDLAIADGWKMPDDPDTAPACDGLLLHRLAQFARFHYVPQRIVTHRRHVGAAFHKPQ